MEGLDYCYYGDLPKQEKCCSCKTKLYSTLGKFSGICWKCFITNRARKSQNNWVLNIKVKGNTKLINSEDKS